MLAQLRWDFCLCLRRLVREIALQSGNAVKRRHQASRNESKCNKMYQITFSYSVTRCACANARIRHQRNTIIQRQSILRILHHSLAKAPRTSETYLMGNLSAYMIRFDVAVFRFAVIVDVYSFRHISKNNFAAIGNEYMKREREREREKNRASLRNNNHHSGQMNETSEWMLMFQSLRCTSIWFGLHLMHSKHVRCRYVPTSGCVTMWR